MGSSLETAVVVVSQTCANNPEWPAAQLSTAQHRLPSSSPRAGGQTDTRTHGSPHRVPSANNAVHDISKEELLTLIVQANARGFTSGRIRSTRTLDSLWCIMYGKVTQLVVVVVMVVVVVVGERGKNFSAQEI